MRHKPEYWCGYNAGGRDLVAQVRRIARKMDAHKPTIDALLSEITRLRARQAKRAGGFGIK